MPTPRKNSVARIFPSKLAVTSPLRGIPLAPGQELTLRSDAEHSLFVRCAELYRILDLLARTTEHLVEAYSKFRTREPFRDALEARHYPADEARAAVVDPQAEALLLGAMNSIHELRLRLSYVDALPFAVKEDIEAERGKLERIWDEIRGRLSEKLGWTLASPGA